MVIRMIALGMCCGLFAAAHAGEIYKWKDESGNTHYGDSAREAKPGAKTIDVKNSELTEEQRQEAEARVVREKTLLQKKGAPAARPSMPTASSPATAKAGKGSDCEEAWRKYRESDACFAPYRLANGGIKAEAFQHCVEVQQPQPCQ